MKDRPKGFLSKKHIDQGGEIFNYIAELHEYLWKFVREVMPGASGSLKWYLDKAISQFSNNKLDRDKVNKIVYHLAGEPLYRGTLNKAIDQILQLVPQHTEEVEMLEVDLKTRWGNEVRKNTVSMADLKQPKDIETKIREIVNKYDSVACALAMSEDIDWRESLVLELSNLISDDKGEVIASGELFTDDESWFNSFIENGNSIIRLDALCEKIDKDYAGQNIKITITKGE